MKLGVVGGRNFTDKQRMWDILNAGIHQITLIISGGARGADTMAEDWANNILKIEPLIFKADWDNLDVESCLVKTRDDGTQYNALAGYNRNQEIVNNSDKILAFWDGKSPGTKSTINLAKKLGKPCTVVSYLG